MVSPPRKWKERKGLANGDSTSSGLGFHHGKGPSWEGRKEVADEELGQVGHSLEPMEPRR